MEGFRHPKGNPRDPAMTPAVFPGGGEAFKRECRRKAFHQLLLGYLAAYSLCGYPRIVWVSGAWTILVAAAETLRLKARWARPFFLRWFSGIIRDKEMSRYSGAFFAAAGVWLTFFFFGDEPRVVTAAILFLTLGDAASPLVGLRFGYGPYAVLGVRRSLDGTLAGFAVAFLIGLGAGFSAPVALAAAFVFSLVDTIPIKPDDNFWIPFAGAAALHFLSGARHG